MKQNICELDTMIFFRDVYKRQVQNKLKSRQRPGQTNEISLFAGLVKCGESGKSLTVRYTCLLYTSRCV